MLKILNINKNAFRVTMTMSLLLLQSTLIAQTNPTSSFGNTFIHSEGNITIFGDHTFRLPNDPGTQPGIIGGEREPAIGYFNFAPGATWVEADNTKYVDGYVRHFGNTKFLFPLGDNGLYRPAAVSGGTYVEACYFASNPTIAVTSDIRGGDFPVLPQTGPFDANLFDDAVIKVSEFEYWDINGTDPTIITLTWDSNSNVDLITSNDLERLAIVGWNGAQWEYIPSYIDLTTISIADYSASFTGPAPTYASGSISTKVPVVPSSYEVYTLASSCLYMDLDVSNEMLICLGEEFTLTANSYDEAELLWNTGETGPTITDSPTENTLYSVTATLGSCEVTREVFVEVRDLQVDLGLDTFVCSGNDMTIVADANYPGTYQWEHRGVLTFGSNSITLENLNTPSTLNVTVTDDNGCTAIDDLFIDIRQSPDVFTGRDASICLGDSTFIQAFGSESGYGYEWSTGDTSSLIWVQPLQTTTYEVSLTENGCEDVSFVIVEVFPQAFVEITNDNIICPGDFITLTAEGTEGTFEWSNGATTQTITVNPVAGDTYSVTLTSPGNCEWVDEITFESFENTLVVPQNINICEGETVNLSVSGIYDSVLWSNGMTSDEISVQPSTTTTYEVSFYYGNCIITREITVTVDNVLVVDLGPDLDICQGESVILSSNSGGQHMWSTNETTPTITVSPFSTETYSVTVTSGGCIDDDEITVNVNPNPAYVEIVTDPLFCPGEEVLLQASGSQGDYLWSNGNTSSSFSVSPNNNQTFSVTVTNAFGCQYSDTITFQSFENSSVDLGSDRIICIGESVQLQVTGNYQDLYWSNGSTNDFINVSPLTTTSYYVTATLNGCESYDTVTVNVVNLLILDLGPDITICNGEEVELSIDQFNGGFAWSTGQSGSSITVSPSSTTNYVVTLTSGNCEETEEITVFVDDPLIELSGDQFYCPGESITINANATPGDIFWSNGATGNSITVSPVEDEIFTATLVSPNGCTSSANFTPVAIDLSSISLGPDISICEGAPVTLNVNGTYDLISWSNGSVGNSINVTPLNSTTYSVTVTEGSCSVSDTIEVNVSEDISLDLGNDVTICPGETTTIGTSGAGNYLWNNNATSSNINVSPLTTSTYHLTVTSGECEAVDSITVIVADSPTIEITGENSICPGFQTTLVAEGSAGIYQWNNGATSQQITVTPNPGQTYTVTVTTPEGCTANDQITISAFNAQSIELGEDLQLCEGETVDLSITGTFDVITWSTGDTGPSISISPTTTTIVSVSAWQGTCEVTDEITLEVVDQLNLNLGPDVTICNGQSTLLGGSIAGSYLWSTGETSDHILVSPDRTTTYTATVTSGSCQSIDQIMVIVENQAYIEITSDNYFCLGDEIQLTTEGSVGTYQWSTGHTTKNINIIPVAGQSYSVTVTNGDGCIGTDEITMLAFQERDVISNDSYNICDGQAVSLNITQPYNSILWEDGSTDNPRIVTPSETTDYSVTVFYKTCSVTDLVTVNVNTDLGMDLGMNTQICLGDSIELGTDIIGQYQWSTGDTSQYITVSPGLDTEYHLTLTSGQCTAEDSIFITIDDVFVEITNEPVFCEEDLVDLNVISSGGSFLWSTGDTTESISALPLSNTTYSVTLTSENGCQDTDQVTFTKYGNGDISLGPDITICQGGSAELTVRGLFDSVIWSDGFTGSTRMVTPGSTRTYSVTGILGSCLSFDQITVFVEQSLDLNLGPDITICPGQTVELKDIDTGGSYLWSTGETTSAINVTPASTTTYTVTVTSGVCVAQDEITVTVSNDCMVDLFVNKSTDNFNPTVGDTIEFSILVGNEGLVDATNLEVQEIIQSGFEYISHTATAGFYSNNASMWYIDILPPGEVELLFITVEVLPTGDYFNVAQIVDVDQLDEDSDPDDDDETEDDFDKIILDVQADEEIPDNTSEIGDYVWFDSNGDGFQNTIENGIENIEVRLYSSADFNQPYATQYTDSQGYFCFTNLSSGAYFVKFMVPDTLVVTKPKVSGNNTSLHNKDSDIEHTFGYGTTNMIALGIDEKIKSCDGGLYTGGSIGDIVWRDGISGIDNKYDGDLIDQGVEDVTLRLYDFVQDTLIAETTTDANGNYAFTNLKQGDYYLQLVETNGEVLSPVEPNKFAEDIDSDFDQISLKTGRITLGPGEIKNDVDAGLTIALPLTLVDFWGERIYDEQFNRLFWTTESEFNTDKFIIQRRLDPSQSFSDIGEVMAAGNSSETLYYTFDDLNSKEAGEYFYRLKMLDFDGRYEYSPIIVIKVYEEGELNDDETSFKIYPIPTTDYLKLEITTLQSNHFDGFLVNNLGQHVRTFSKQELIAGANLITIDVIDLPQGQYYLNFHVGEKQHIAKVLILD